MLKMLVDKNINICGKITEDLLGVGAEVNTHTKRFGSLGS
jgi:hypothetical protein